MTCSPFRDVAKIWRGASRHSAGNDSTPPGVNRNVKKRRRCGVPDAAGAARNNRHPDLHKAINEAFRIAERQLTELKRQRDGRTKAADHDAENQFLGQVAEIAPEQDFGFLLTKEGSLLYFHRNSLLNGDFDALAPGDRVYYNEAVGDTGPIATKVRVKGGP
jgi:cold shock CspA family protein